MPQTTQAVLLIHGIGEQRPMDTLRAFVDTMWRQHTAIHHPHAAANSDALVWSKPDTVSDSFELRRLVTPQNRAGLRTDFFEFYWQHLMQGTTYRHVLAWTWTLLARRPRTVPQHLRLAYWLLVVLAAGVVGLAVHAAYSAASDAPPWPAWWSVVGSLVLVPIAGFVVLGFLGDAARYLHVAPANVQCRHAIRQAGVKVLRTLHDRGYDRIVVVGHSLGSVIGYDLLTHAWPSFHRDAPAKPSAGGDAPVAPSMVYLDELEAVARGEDTAGADVPAAQRRYFDELVQNASRWRVTDFVTLGSPLAHAAILLARDGAQLEQRQRDRELPTCLPALETVVRDGEKVRRFAFEHPVWDNRYRVPHHAAVFAPTRWTNLYFPCKGILWGDFVGGPLAGVWGRGVRDVEVTTPKWRGWLAHTRYWTLAADGAVPQCVAQLRSALDLVDDNARQNARADSPGPDAGVTVPFRGARG